MQRIPICCNLPKLFFSISVKDVRYRHEVQPNDSLRAHEKDNVAETDKQRLSWLKEKQGLIEL